MVFDYVTKYFYQHETIAPIQEFSITDTDYSEFRDFLKEKDFTYTSESQNILKKLKKVAKDEKYNSFTENELNALSKKLSPNIDRDLKNYKKEIVELINHEIIKRYYYQEGGIKFALKNDKALKEAIKIIKDKKRYSGILKGSIIENK